MEQIKETITMLYEEGLEVWTYFVFGFPGETRESIRQTIQFAKRMPIDIAYFCIATPYPGTEFHRMCKAHGWLKSEKWADYDQGYSAIVRYPHLNAEEISGAVKKAYLSFYLKPRQIIKISKEMFSSWENRSKHAKGSVD